jgi:hypothetical protein
LVGDTVLVTTLPKKAVPVNGVSVPVGSPSREAWESDCLAMVARRRPRDNEMDALLYAPAIIKPGLTISGVQIYDRPLGPETIKKMSDAFHRR